MSHLPSKKSHQEDFQKIHQLIKSSKEEVYQHINKMLIQLYWRVGEFVSQKITSAHWGQNVVDSLSAYINDQESGLKGFSPRNIWRMKQFYETYAEHEKLSPLVTEITWTNHLAILSKAKTIEEKEFYLRLTKDYRYSKRELERLIDTATFERVALGEKLSPVVTEIGTGFKDTYIFEFLTLPTDYKENDLRRGLVKNLKHFLLELGPDFTFVGEEYVVQVGKSDFRIDLLMYHRGLNCMVAIELKTTSFQPEHLGKLQFYLEALDQNVKKPHENPSIGILICADKDDEVVQFAMNRNMSPAMVAEYQTKLIDKSVIQKKLHEINKTLSDANED